MSSGAASSGRTPLSDLILYLKVGFTGWIVVYLFLGVFFSISLLPLHLVCVGICVCLLTYFRLPPPNPVLVRELLGTDCPLQRHSQDWEIAHRAACLDGPENSLEALRLAAGTGRTNWVEFDVSFSSDLTPVVFHDDTLDRVTTGSGLISETSFTSLSKLDLSVKHPLSSSFSGVNIPTVEQFVSEALRLDLKMIIDLKTFERPEETVELILSLFAKHPALRTKALVSSFFPQLLYRIRARDPDIVVSVATRPHFLGYITYEGSSHNMRPRYSGIQQVLARVADCVYEWLLPEVLWFVVGISAILPHRAMVTKQFVDDWKSKGVRVMAWTVNSPLEKAHLKHELGVQVITDTLERIPPEKWIID